MRNARLLVPALLLTSTLAAAQGWVDLDRPGVLDAIAKEDPVRFAKISIVLNAASATPCETLPKVLPVEYQVKVQECAPHMTLTSYPPKRLVTFGVDGVSYASNVAMNYKPATLKPAQ